VTRRSHVFALFVDIQGISRVIMSPRVKMQPTIHFRKKARYFNYIASFFGNVVLEIPCMYLVVGTRDKFNIFLFCNKNRRKRVVLNTNNNKSGGF
jgi:hypothetical protein